MKTIRKIGMKEIRYTVSIGMVTLGMLGVLCMSLMTQAVYAKGHSNNYRGMSYVAEQEIREREQKAIAIIKTADNEKIYVYSPEDTDSAEKIDVEDKKE